MTIGRSCQLFLLTFFLLSCTFTIREIRENMYFTYASSCPVDQLQKWNCFWCNKTDTKLKFITKLTGIHNSFGYVAEGPTKSKFKFLKFKFI